MDEEEDRHEDHFVLDYSHDFNTRPPRAAIGPSVGGGGSPTYAVSTVLVRDTLQKYFVAPALHNGIGDLMFLVDEAVTLLAHSPAFLRRHNGQSEATKDQLGFCAAAVVLKARSLKNMRMPLRQVVSLPLCLGRKIDTVRVREAMLQLAGGIATQQQSGLGCTEEAGAPDDATVGELIKNLVPSVLKGLQTVDGPRTRAGLPQTLQLPQPLAAGWEKAFRKRSSQKHEYSLSATRGELMASVLLISLVDVVREELGAHNITPSVEERLLALVDGSLHQLATTVQLAPIRVLQSLEVYTGLRTAAMYNGANSSECYPRFRGKTTQQVVHRRRRRPKGVVEFRQHPPVPPGTAIPVLVQQQILPQGTVLSVGDRHQYPDTKPLGSSSSAKKDGAQQQWSAESIGRLFAAQYSAVGSRVEVSDLLHCVTEGSLRELCDEVGSSGGAGDGDDDGSLSNEFTGRIDACLAAVMRSAQALRAGGGPGGGVYYLDDERVSHDGEQCIVLGSTDECSDIDQYIRRGKNEPE